MDLLPLINTSSLLNDGVLLGEPMEMNNIASAYAQSTGQTLNNDNGTHPGVDIGVIQDDIKASLMQISSLLRNICIPIISAIGLLGNSLSLLVFANRRLKHTSSSMFLAALALVDNLFLLNLFLMWIDGVVYNILGLPMVCEFIMFVTYVTGFLSVWFIVGFTTERYMAICYPLRWQLMFSRFREKLIVAILVGLAFLLYNHSFWTIQVLKFGPRYTCVPKLEMLGFLNVITWIDTMVTMVIPFILISYLNVKVLFAAANCHRHVCCHQGGSLQTGKNAYALPQNSIRYRSQIRVTRTLILVSSTFLVLNLPSHALRLHNLIVTTAQPDRKVEVSVQMYFVQEIANILFYCTFSCNFFLYAFFGRHFQRNLKAILVCRAGSNGHKAEVGQQLSSFRLRTTTTSSFKKETASVVYSKVVTQDIGSR